MAAVKSVRPRHVVTVDLETFWRMQANSEEISAGQVAELGVLNTELSNLFTFPNNGSCFTVFTKPFFCS
jgi:hypothetical protein